jgi:tripartite-type tricarboxylate transporter receptor subunit TctC
MMNHSKLWMVALFCVLSLLAAANASAQGAFPERPIQALVAYAAGGSTDVGARIIAESMRKSLNQPVLVVNKPGGAAALAGNELFKSKPDGYTIGMFTSGSTTPEYGANPERFLYKSKDLQPVAQWSNNCSVLMVRYEEPYNTLEALVKYAKANPNKLRIGLSGRGNRDWIQGVLLCQQAGIKMLEVPFSGAGEAMTALLGGSVDVVNTSWGGITIAQFEAKKIRVLAITEGMGSELLPGVKTVTELGYPTDVPENYMGAWVPKGTPAGVVLKLSEAIMKATQDPEVKQKMLKIGLAPNYKGAKELDQLVENFGKFQLRILKELGVLK